VDLYKILEECNDYIIQFGGHKYAAGLMIKEENYDLFKDCFEKAVSAYLKENLPEQEISIESEIKLDSITPKFFRILNQFEPFGPGNWIPIFMTKGLSLDGKLNKVGKDKEHLKISIKQKSKTSFPAIGFWMSDKCDRVNTKAPFDMAYSIDQNTWNGKTSIQLKIKDIK
jgi:single-stranded-DNA-specific exonuclease